MCTDPRHIRLKSVSDWDYRHGYQSPKEVDVPCGKCAECMKTKQNAFASRIYEEVKHLSTMFFVTLTYSPEYEPWAVSLFTKDEDTGELVRITDPQPIFTPAVLDDLRERSKSPLYKKGEISPCRIFEHEIHLQEGQTFNGFVAHERPQPLYIESQKFFEGKRQYKKPKTVVHRQSWYDKQSLNRKRSLEGLTKLSRLDQYMAENHFTVANYDPRKSDGVFRPIGIAHLLARYTPTLYFRDVSLTIKKWRSGFQYQTGHKLPDFRYCCVGEYGKKNSQRPHYHLLLFGKGLTREHVEDFLSYWNYGRTDLVEVGHLNKDNTDAFALTSRYVSKYVTKGSFATDAVKEGLTLYMKNCCSHKLGQVLPQHVVDSYLCKDLFEYDQEKAEDLPKEVLEVLLPEIVKRSRYTIRFGKDWELTFALPVAFKKQIFNYRVDKVNRVGCFSPLYYMVQDFIRSRNKESGDKQFAEFLASWRGDLSDACLAFDNLSKKTLAAREASARSYFKRLYSKGKS